MADKTIGELTDGGVPADTDKFETENAAGSVSERHTIDELAQATAFSSRYVESSGGSLAATAVTVADSAGLLTGTNAETALAELANGSAAVNVVAASGATETLTLAPVHKVTMDEDCTFTFPSPSTNSHTFRLRLVGEFTPTFPASVDWAGASAPTYVGTGGGTIYIFSTDNGGTDWEGALFGGAGGFG